MKCGMVLGWSSWGWGLFPLFLEIVCTRMLRRGCEWELLHFLGWASSRPPQLEPVVRPLETEAGDFPAGRASVLARDSLP